MKSNNKISIEVWSEITCPFCPVGEVHLKEGIALYAKNPQVEIIHRSFRLLPGKALMLESERYVQTVKNDEDRARALGIRSVPTIVLSGQIALSATEPPERIVQALDLANSRISNHHVKRTTQ